MPVKMKVLVFGARAICILNFVVTLTLFGISIYQLLSEQRQISVPIIDEWRTLVMVLLSLQIYVICLTGFWFFAATKYKKGEQLYAIGVMLTHLIGLFCGIYLCGKCLELKQRVAIDKEDIFISTKTAISNGIKISGDAKWVPNWLSTIQEESQNCCGIRTFNDWNEFWEPINSHVPKSCCIIKDDEANSECHTDLQNIPFPDTVANNIKVDRGCHEEINTKIHQILNDTFTFIIIMTVYLAISTIAFIILYLCGFFRNSTNMNENEQNPNQILLTEEQTWATLDFFPNRENNNTMTSITSEISAGEGFVELENKTTNTDVIIQQDGQPSYSKEPVPLPNKQQITTSELIIPIEQIQFIPEVNPLPELVSEDPFERAGIYNVGPSEQFPDNLYTRERINGRSFLDKHRHRRTRHNRRE